MHLRSKQISKWTEYAGKGCDTSQEKLVALKKACGTECSQELAQKVSQLEGWASKGCGESKEKLAKLNAIANDKPVSVLAQYESLCASAEKGCSTSKEKLVALKKACGTDCSKDLGQKIAQYEKWSEGGCGESKEKLAHFVAIMKGKKAKPVSLSTQYAKLCEGAENGCASSKEKV